VPIHLCPVCAKPTPPLLDDTRKNAIVNYHRCSCGHVWTTSKKDGSLVRHVRTRPSDAQARTQTGVRCPACSQPVAVIDNLVDDNLLMVCPACNHRWSTRCRHEP
jgi:hypothetical protein